MPRDPRITPRVPAVTWTLSRRVLVGGYRTTTHDSGVPTAGLPVVDARPVEVAP